MTRIRTGIEVLRAHDFAPLKGKRIGLLTNPSAVDAELASTIDILRDASDVRLIALFAPEHGIQAARMDGETIHSSVDARTRLPVYSLYGENLHPTRAMMDNIDLMVCDIQDVGTRYYTYLWTLTYILEAMGEYGIPTLILDRPNPLGDKIRGPMLQPEYASLVGRFPIPIQHGMTMGEMARYLNARYISKPADLTVIACEGEPFTRGIEWGDLDRPFIPPSPAMPHLSTAQHYPGACLIEGTTLSEGRGTALPFEIIGAPYIDGVRLAAHLNAQEWAGVRFRPHVFYPSASKYTGEACEGVQAHIIDLARFDAVAVWLGVIREIVGLYPDDVGWQPPIKGLRPFDRLIGNGDVRPLIVSGAPLADIMAGWAEEERLFREARRAYLLYGAV